MNVGEVKIGVVAQEKNILVLQVRLLYSIGTTWYVADNGRILVNGENVRRPQFDIDESLLFDKEEDAVNAAKQMKLAPKKGGGRHWK